jgi:hypothetical protein
MPALTVAKALTGALSGVAIEHRAQSQMLIPRRGR